jgi:hypothetical protein
MPQAHEGVGLHFHQDHDAWRMVYVGKVDELWKFEIIIHLSWHMSFATPKSLLCLPKVVPFHALPYIFGTFMAVIFSTLYLAYYQKKKKN